MSIETERSAPSRWPLVLGGLLTAMAVILAALSSHALPDVMADPIRSHRLNTALQMHEFSAPSLILIGLALLARPHHRAWHIAAALLLTGIVLFCGNLYLLAMTQSSPAPWLTPLGGLCLITAWLVFALGAVTIKPAA